MTHIVEVHVAKSKKALDEGVYKVFNQQKFQTKEQADQVIKTFNAICDRNRRAIYVGESSD